jgi:hypothetical protein
VTVRRLSAGPAVQFVLAVAGAVLAILEFDFPAVLIVVVGVLALYRLWSLTLVLKVDDDGVRLGRAFVPWHSIDSVVAEGEEVGIRLRREAELPREVRGVIRHPDGSISIPPDLRIHVPRLDRAGLAIAVGSRARLDHDLNRR